MAKSSLPVTSAHFWLVFESGFAWGLRCLAAYSYPALAAATLTPMTLGPFFAKVDSSTDSSPVNSSPITRVAAPTATVFCMTGSSL